MPHRLQLLSAYFEWTSGFIRTRERKTTVLAIKVKGLDLPKERSVCLEAFMVSSSLTESETLFDGKNI